jgi:hypothetical protein
MWLSCELEVGQPWFNLLHFFRFKATREENGAWTKIVQVLGRFVISGFRRDADEICALLGYNAASSGNP